MTYTYMNNIERIILKIKERWDNRHLEEALPFISVGILAAIICALFAIIFSRAEAYSLIVFRKNPYLIFAVSPTFLIISYLLVRYFSPGAAGSGIPQVITCLDKSQRHLSSIFLRKSVISIKILSSLFAVFAGAAIGREGPSLQIAAAISHNVGQFFHRYKIPIKMDQLLIAGAASGLAAAFNTPIGGIVYAIEELSQDHIRSYKDVLLISVVISGLTAQLISGNYLYLGYPQVLTKLGILQLLVISLVSLVAGVLGAIFSKILLKLSSWRANRSLSSQLLILAFVGLILATMFYFMGERYIYSGKETIHYILFSKGETTQYEAFARFFMPIISSMTGIAGGIFAPSLSAGAALGGAISELFDPSIKSILALTGMIAFLTGVTRTPITSFILVLEMTDRHSAVFPMMLAAVLSSVSAHLVSEKSFYEESSDLIKNNNRLLAMN